MNSLPEFMGTLATFWVWLPFSVVKKIWFTVWPIHSGSEFISSLLRIWNGLHDCPCLMSVRNRSIAIMLFCSRLGCFPFEKPPKFPGASPAGGSSGVQLQNSCWLNRGSGVLRRYVSVQWVQTTPPFVGLETNPETHFLSS